MTQMIKWKVSEAPTGPYRSFQHRGWPMGYYNNANKNVAAQITCDDAYSPARVKTGVHAPLKLLIADYSVNPWEWRRVKGECATLDDAKAKLLLMLEKFPHFKLKNG